MGQESQSARSESLVRSSPVVRFSRNISAITPLAPYLRDSISPASTQTSPASDGTQSVILREESEDINWQPPAVQEASETPLPASRPRFGDENGFFVGPDVARQHFDRNGQRVTEGLLPGSTISSQFDPVNDIGNISFEAYKEFFQFVRQFLPHTDSGRDPNVEVVGSTRSANENSRTVTPASQRHPKSSFSERKASKRVRKEEEWNVAGPEEAKPASKRIKQNPPGQTPRLPVPLTEERTAEGRRKATSRNKHYLQAEKEWLIEMFDNDNNHELTWNKIVQLFNDRWQGVVVKGEPRPPRTVQGLQDMTNHAEVGAAKKRWQARELAVKGKKKQAKGNENVECPSETERREASEQMDGNERIEQKG
ncbi:hypothetical protein NA57DRAFT_57261 [Rhizodiscina lignyota]|uniref:Uncharacterized protein n=1 Tax=Rhizodiscina lignyota TaxID=1504668 RepID=A0A9P4M5Q1_9PEZI|nr:hypothetical protein NA57DRAFT_57261 [Rhizodiscina lignyota]